MSNFDLGVWEDFKGQINRHLQTDSIDNFHRWPVMLQTMIAGVDEVEVNELLQSPLWTRWNETLGETVLQPNSYHRFPGSSTNNMHHAYSLDVMMKKLNIPLNEFSIVAEFGGGYGNTCRLFKKWGHNKNYIIYDIPELISIQKHYLAANSINDVTYMSGIEDPTPPVRSLIDNKSLFLGLWSISETPRHMRNHFFNILDFFHFDNIFLAMGGTFYAEDNIDWLNKEVIPTLEALGHRCEFIKIAHGSDMWYFVSQRIDNMG